MKHFQLSSLVCLILVCCSGLAWGQPSPGQPPRLKFKRITLEQGLSSTLVRSVNQDQDGFIWFGTEGGLNRYDGNAIKVIRSKSNEPNTLASNYIDLIYQDRQKRLWVGTAGGGLHQFLRDQQFTLFRNDPRRAESLINNWVKTMVEDSQGQLWVGTDGGITIFDAHGKFVKSFQVDGTAARSLSHNYVKTIYVDRAGTLWVGTDGGLNRFDPADQGFTRFQHNPGNPNSLSSNLVKAIFEDSAGRFWIGTDDGLNLFDRATQTVRRYHHTPTQSGGLSNDTVTCILESKAGQLWVGTDGGGINLYTPQTDQFSAVRYDPHDPYSLSSDRVTCLFRDVAGSLWVGTYGGGINFFDPLIQRFQVIESDPLNPNSLSLNQVWSVCKDRLGAIWIGTTGGGLNRLDPQTGHMTVFRADPGQSTSLSHDEVLAVYEDRLGAIWIGTRSGLNRYDPEKKRFVRFLHNPADPQSLSGNHVITFAEDLTGRLWIGTYGEGLNLYDPKQQRFTIFRPDPAQPNSLCNNVVNYLYRSRDGMIWIATAGGLNRLDPVTLTFTAFRHDPANPKSLSHDVVYSIREDNAGRLWVGTSSGLNLFDPQTGTFTVFSEEDGFLNDTILGILTDETDHLWLSTKKGLVKFDPNQRQVRVFDMRDGLPSDEFNKNAFFQSPDGELLFGSTAGLVRLYPGQLVNNPFVPPVVITSFRIFDKPSERYTSDFLTHLPASGETGGIVLPYDQNFFTFEFAALNFILPEKNQYTYRLEGLDPRWIEAGTRHTASYTAVPAGNYVFRVKASNNDGVWNEQELTVRLTITPPPWQTWWARLLYVTGLVGGGFWLVWSRIQKFRERAELREARLRVKAAEAEAQVAHLQAEAAEQLRRQNEALARKNTELEASQRQADRIFSTLTEALEGMVLDGKYRLDEKIGIGGFGAVFQATHLGLNRKVAVKVFRPLPGNDSAEQLERFRREGMSATRVNHPNAIAILDSAISEEGIAYLVMEFLVGHTLATELHIRKRLSLKRCAEILTPVCQVLAEAHRAGIIHRDIKPENIFLHQGSQGEIVKLLDFGIAKLTGNEATSLGNLTLTGNLIGTPMYMSPEQLRYEPYDGKADVYSLGVTLYEMLCGRTPFRSTSNNVVEIILKQMRDDPPPMRSANPEIPSEVEQVVRKTLDKDPANRPSPLELANEFAAAVAGYLVGTSSDSPTETNPRIEPDEDELLENHPTLTTAQVQENAPTVAFQRPEPPGETG